MPAELVGPTGVLSLYADGGFRVRRGKDGPAVLVQDRAFIEIYGVAFPALSLASVQPSEGGLRAVFETGWKHLPITLDATATSDGFRLVWSAPSDASSVGVAMVLPEGGPWYGMGERIVQSWPLSKLGALSEPFGPVDHGRDGTLSISTPLWLNRAGGGLLVTEDTGQLDIAMHRDGDDCLRLVQRRPEQQPMNLDEQLEKLSPRLSVMLLVAPTLPAAYQLAVGHLGQPSSRPPAALLARPTWTTWARYKMHITQNAALEFADDIVAHGYPHSVFEIDDRWQSAYGDLRFDSRKFPDPAAMTQALHRRGFRVTLWVPPFFERGADAFAEAAACAYLVRHIDSGDPALARWWQGYGGLLDVSNPEALDWWLAGLRRLQREYGIDGFKFDGGEGNFLPHEARSAGKLTTTSYADQYVAFVARNFEWTEVRTGWRSQRQGVLFREWDRWSRWGVDNGLHSVLTAALTLGLLGYPFVLPDMIGGNAYGDEVPDPELMVRWAELTALLPAMQFSLAPWDFGPEVDEICLRYASLHEELSSVLERCVEQALEDGTPIVRPLFWHAPHDHAAYLVDDQFTLGERLLVAPVLAPGVRQRSVYLPAGRWRDYWTGAEHRGPDWLTTHPAPLETLPLFERLDGRP
jgi:hypothetical protein